MSIRLLDSFSAPLPECLTSVRDEDLLKPKVYPSGVEFLSQGADAVEVFFVHSGLVKLFRSEANGRRILLDLRFQGSLIGAAAVIGCKPQPFTAITGTTCKISSWDSRRFQSLIVANTTAAAFVRDVLSGEVLHHIARISQIACLPARERLEYFLEQICEAMDETPRPRDQLSTKVQLPVKYSELAELLSITPTYLCRLLNNLEDEGALCRRGGWVIVQKRAPAVRGYSL